MARPVKKGLDYYPVDVNINQDEKIIKLKVKYGFISKSILEEIWSKIYGLEGYYIKWSDEIAEIIAYQNHIEYELLQKVIDYSVALGIFDINLYQKYGILTSKRIQYTYVEAKKNSKNVELLDKILLLKPEKLIDFIVRKNQKINIINENEEILTTISQDGIEHFLSEKIEKNDNSDLNIIKPDLININSDLTTIKPDLSAQRKEKKRKENKSKKEKEKKDLFFIFWNKYKATKRKFETEFENFKKHNDWEDVLDDLIPALESQLLVRQRKKENNEFNPPWKNLSNWINQRCWEEVSEGNNANNDDEQDTTDPLAYRGDEITIKEEMEFVSNQTEYMQRIYNNLNEVLDELCSE